MKGGYVYILANKHNTVLYTGVTSQLKKRIYKHKIGTASLFTSKYNVNKLVWFEDHPTIRQAIEREKQIKNWKREWKIELIKSMNPDFRDLYNEI
jgi:putative endonuclease